MRSLLLFVGMGLCFVMLTTVAQASDGGLFGPVIGFLEQILEALKLLLESLPNIITSLLEELINFFETLIELLNPPPSSP